ncbi:hypothetical protein [Methylobacterium iners]|uniref:Uncharacterized protein n=1 Tax=Methylobacterium iners TaxID=418707 RepID=A0ABQ4RVP0_9HYPH|nr:hypothetical protein [Methylobacterium iners]GJD94450.1 hypothetical protein OCOJLMKI_1652 [Methylobacterium iners]
MSRIDHIAELRAELAHCVLTKRERAQIEAELKSALLALAPSDDSTPEAACEAYAG